MRSSEPKNLLDGAARMLRRPVLAVSLLVAVAFGVEVAQYFPEQMPGAHAFGEVVRNLSYALVGAVVFQWLVVDVPARQRRLATYAFCKTAFQLLLVAGPGLLYQYQHAAKIMNEELDIWDERSLARFATKVQSVGPDVFGPDRAGLLRTTIDVGLPRALTELAASAPYLDVEVAHALARFPRQDGISVLQVLPNGSGGVEPRSDVHITWTLLEAARRLYQALLATGAYGPEVFEGSVAGVPLSAGVLMKGEVDPST